MAGRGVSLRRARKCQGKRGAAEGGENSKWRGTDEKREVCARAHVHVYWEGMAGLREELLAPGIQAHKAARKPGHVSERGNAAACQKSAA